MKKKLYVLLSMVLATSTVLAGCGKKTEEPKNEQVSIEVVTENDGKDVGNVEGQMTEDGYVEAQYNGRQRLGDYLIHSLDSGMTFSSLPAEKKYFDYLETKWVDDSWVNPDASEGDVFQKDVFTAIKGGLYDRMIATIGDYTETETEMTKVYKGMEPKENEINEDYVKVALADIAGFNGIGFTNSTTIQDTVTLGVVIDMASIFAHDDSFKLSTYVDSEKVDITKPENLQNPATGYDINYAFAVALGLDTTDPAQSLRDAGYSIFDADVASVSILTYDRIVVANAKVYAFTEKAVEVEETPVVEDNNKPSGGESGTTPTEEKPAVEEKPADDNKPADNTPTEGIGKKVYINGVEYTYGGTAPNGTVVDDPAFYNHPEAAIMTGSELAEKACGMIMNPDGTVSFGFDATWEQDSNTRVDNYNKLLYQYGKID